MTDEKKQRRRARDAARYAANPEKVRARNAAWRATPHGVTYRAAYYAANREKARTHNAAWYAANKEHSKAYRVTNKERDAARKAAYRTANPDKALAIKSRYKAKKTRQLAVWRDDKAIAHIYERAAMLTAVTGIQFTVDHLYPLQGKTVSGLHTEANLVTIPASENFAKCNQLPEDFYRRRPAPPR
jgi:hypothetical protein